MDRSPKIAVTCSYNEESGIYQIKQGYLKALTDSGAIPYVIPHGSEVQNKLDEILVQVDGLLLSGGTDLDPNLFGEEPRHKLTKIVPGRDSLEIELVRKCIDLGLPFLGICRGIQSINIAQGGGSYQDIDEQFDDPIRHRQDAPRWHPTHEIEIKSGSLLEKILERDTLSVNSFHHQSVKNVATNLQVSARSTDGVIEAIETETGVFQIGVQWHPERMWKKNPIHQKLFSGLVKASKSEFSN